MIDIKRLKDEASILEKLLIKYSQQEPEAKECHMQLSPMFKQIQSSMSLLPYKHIPCGRYFSEGKLGKFSDLESAYSSFYVTAIDYDRAKLKDFFDNI